MIVADFPVQLRLGTRVSIVTESSASAGSKWILSQANQKTLSCRLFHQATRVYQYALFSSLLSQHVSDFDFVSAIDTKFLLSHADEILDDSTRLLPHAAMLRSLIVKILTTVFQRSDLGQVCTHTSDVRTCH